MNPYLDIVFRSLVVYFFMVLVMRFFGKAQLSQLNTEDIILLFLVSNAVQNAMVGSDISLQGGLLAALVLFLVNFVFKKILFKNKKISSVINGKPVVLLRDGMVDFKKLDEVGITIDELEEVIREHGIEYVNGVKLAILETDGNISVISTDNNGTKFSRHKRKNQRKENYL